MAELFMILLAGGVMLASTIPDPFSVTLHWLRLAGIIALSFASLSIFFRFRNEHALTTPIMVASVTAAAILAQLAFVQIGMRGVQRFFALTAFAIAIYAAIKLLPGSNIGAAVISYIGASAFCGIALMEMLLGHAYLTASNMTMKPFRRLHGALIATWIVRLSCATAVVLILSIRHPINWGRDGLLVGMRWFVGLLVPVVFIYMIRDCIKRRSTQSATGILYVAGVVIFIGEAVAMYLVRETGLPF